MTPQTGTVKLWKSEKGYGFIRLEDGSGDVFVHYSAIEMSGRKDLEVGQQVQVVVVDGERGPAAKQCWPV